LFVKKVVEGREGREKVYGEKSGLKKPYFFYFIIAKGRFVSTISQRAIHYLIKKMSDSSVSWIGLALSALLVIDKLLSKSKKIKCTCCGSEFEASENLSTPMTPRQKVNQTEELKTIKLETIHESQIKLEEVNKKD
jgi:hypothetical protein